MQKKSSKKSSSRLYGTNIHRIFFSCPFSAGKNKLVAGAGIGIVGALTGNKQLQQAGGGLVGLGVASSLGGHLFGKKKK